MEMTQSNYHFAVMRLRVLLSEQSKPGSKVDIETMTLARLVEDYDAANIGKTIEPYYMKTHDV